MIKVIYEADPEGGKLTMRAEGHAGYAPAGQDIVCAAVSCLMQTLAYSAAEDEHTSSCIYQGKEGPVVSVEAGDSVLMRDKFELVADGLDLLAEQYPENVSFKETCRCAPKVDLQLFAEGGGDGAGAGAAEGTGEAAAAEKAASAPVQGKGREAAAAEVDEMLSPAEEPGAEEDAAEGEEQDGAADMTCPTLPLTRWNRGRRWAFTPSSTPTPVTSTSWTWLGCPLGGTSGWPTTRAKRPT